MGTTSRQLLLSTAFVAVSWTGACRPIRRGQPERSAFLARAPEIRQPSNAVLSPNGSELVFIVGDSLMVVATDSPRQSPTLLATAVSEEASIPVPFAAWSPDSRQLFFRQGMHTGSNGIDWGMPSIVTLGNPAKLRKALPDSMARTLATFQNSLAGGPAWSPRGDKIAFLASERGDASNALRIFVLDVTTGVATRWTGGTKSVVSVAWSPNGRLLSYSTGFGQGPSTIELFADVDSVTHRARAIATDSATFLRDLRWSPSGHFVLAQDQNRRSLVVSLDSALRPTRERHSLPRTRFVGWVGGDSILLTTVPKEMSAQVAMVSYPSGNTQLLTGPDTLATAVGSVGDPREKRARLVAYTMESGEIPSDVWVAMVSPADRLSDPRNITQLNAEFAKRREHVARLFRWPSAEGDSLEAQLLLPKRKGPKERSFPLVVMPYGGYRNQFPRSEYFLDEGIMPLLSAGYAVVRPNTRGTASDHRDQGRYGQVQLQDTNLLLDALVTKGLVDRRRIAVIGHSHGGAMAYYYLTHSSRFCAVVGVNGRADWVLQANYPGDGLLPGILGGTPTELPDVYRKFSPTANARSVTTPLLSVAGQRDTQILPENVQIIADSMHIAGKPVETLTFPDEGHLILKPENVRKFWERTMDFLHLNCP
jgi:dipeptidyl aminopeptidase/acylaminoacyl peptidase